MKYDPELEPIDVTEVFGRTDIGILTVRADEFEAVLKHFSLRRTVKGGKNLYEYASLLRRDGGESTVAVTRSLEQGVSAAQAIARNMIEDLNPSWLLLVGIAGGIPADEYSLGDVLLASRLHDFSVTAALQGQSPEYQVTGGPMHLDVERLLSAIPAYRKRLDGWNTVESIGLNKPLVEIPVDIDAASLYGSNSWREKVQKSLRSNFTNSGSPRLPIYCVAPAASSSTLMKDADLLQVWLKSARAIAAVEMELAGVYLAARHAGSQHVRVLAIRGVSDIVGFRRDSGWTQFACQSAAAFTFSIIQSGVIYLADKTIRKSSEVSISSKKEHEKRGTVTHDSIGKKAKEGWNNYRGSSVNAENEVCEWLSAQHNVLPLKDQPLSISATDAKHPILYNVCSSWGLTRASFIGIAFGFNDYFLYEKLIATENCLKEVMGNFSSNLPDRIWLHNQRDHFLNRPNDLEYAIKNPNGSPIPEDSIIGIFIETSPNKLDREGTEDLGSWISLLINKIFPHKQIAIIVHFICKHYSEAEKTTLKIKEVLSKFKIVIPIEELMLNGMGVDVNTERVPEIHPLRVAPEDERNHFYSLCHHAIKNAAEVFGLTGWKKEALTIYGELDQLLEQMRKNDGSVTIKKLTECSTELTAVYLEGLVEKSGSKGVNIAGKMLKLISEFLPSMILSLVRAFAMSEVRALSHEALSFAADSDNVMGAWLEGCLADESRFPTEEELRSSLRLTASLETLVLAMLRKDSKRSILLLNKIPSRLLTMEVQSVLNLGLGRISEDAFLSEGGDREFSLAIRAQTQFTPSKIREICLHDLLPASAWWLTAGLPVTKDLVKELISLRVGQRAVLGLCTPQEWKVLNKDKVRRHQISEARGFRNLTFRTF